MPIFGHPSITHRHRGPVLPRFQFPVYTSADSYNSLLVPKIVIKSQYKNQIFYSFDPFTYGNNAGGVTYCSVQLGTNQHGTFDIEFEATDKTVDDILVAPSARCYIYFGKAQSQFTPILSGMIRSSGYTRGCENNLLYNISGFGTGIRTNERIMDAFEAPDNLLADGQTIDFEDRHLLANKIIDDVFDHEPYYPESITQETVEGNGGEPDGGFGHINSTDVEVQSDVKDFIPGINHRFQEMSDVINQVEDFTGARFYVDTDDRPQLQPIMTPFSSNTGFIITTTQDLTDDLADNTCYIQTDYSFGTSISKDTGYSSGMYGILSADPIPDKGSSSATLFYENKTVEIAQRFRPPTNPNWRIFAGVELVGVSNVDNENTFRGRWRICKDNNGKPLNSSGIELNKYMLPNELYNTGDGGLQVIQIAGEGNHDLDENKWYWLILSSVNATGTQYWRWYYNTGDTDEINGQVMTNSPGASSDTNGGNGWTPTTGKLMVFTTTRFKAEPFGIYDQKAIDKRILIESVATSFPQQINSKVAANKYLVGLMQYNARPRTVFQFPSVTIPNKTILPGDIAYIVDSRFNFSTSGNPVVTGTITDLQYSFGSKGAGTGASSKGMSDLALNVVSYNQFY